VHQPLVGHAEAQRAFRAAIDSGALHHGWLLTGPQGVGKGMFARAVARRLLAEGAGAALPPGLDLPEEDRTAKLIAAGAHPDYRELTRLPKDPDKPEGDFARSITIAQVRQLQPMFATKPALSPRRVIVIDAVDELERPGASNALLKNLEEPPAGTIFLLVSHAPGKLLPTIRSRCRRLRFDPLSDAEVRRVLAECLPEASADELAALVRVAEGAPGRALRYAGLDLAALDTALTAIARDGDPNNARRAALAKTLGAKAQQPRYEAFLDRAPSFIARQAADREGDALATALDAYAAAQSVAAIARAQSLDAQATVFELAGLVARLGLHPPRAID